MADTRELLAALDQEIRLGVESLFRSRQFTTAARQIEEQAAELYQAQRQAIANQAQQQRQAQQQSPVSQGQRRSLLAGAQGAVLGGGGRPQTGAARPSSSRPSSPNDLAAATAQANAQRSQIASQVQAARAARPPSPPAQSRRPANPTQRRQGFRSAESAVSSSPPPAPAPAPAPSSVVEDRRLAQQLLDLAARANVQVRRLPNGDLEFYRGQNRIRYQQGGPTATGRSISRFR
jgi:hypothetical protein